MDEEGKGTSRDLKEFEGSGSSKTDALAESSSGAEQKQHETHEKPEQPQEHTQHQQHHLQPSPQKQPHQQPQKRQPQNEHKAGKQSSSLKDSIINIYDNQYKKLLIFPAIVVIAAVVILLMSYSTTGDFFQKDISLSGGVSVIAVTDYGDVLALETELSQQFPDSDVSVRKLTQVGESTGLAVEAGMQSEDEISQLISFLSGKLGIPESQLTVQKVGASLGTSFFNQLLKGIAIAFLFMAVTVFVYFRIVAGQWLWLPGLFVVWASFIDIICTLAFVSLIGMHVSAAGLAAFLMLIGYSVDTNILLTVRALKSSEPTLAARV
ncbi:MAG TPA: hypothetical protein VI934_04125, partial [Candidatus Nanoarchaeia archaeon]|nr:hypothetical protein [Candidatus Nanoarchaeia archaeon]